jgi:ribose 5-phosphate isomerase B
MQNVSIILASDHAGFELKEEVKQYLIASGYSPKDHGAFSYEETDDYPDFVQKAAKDVSLGDENTFGFIFGGSGEGEAIAANRYPNVRATTYYGNLLDIVRLGRDHNNANILSFGARFVTKEEAIAAIDLFLKTPFSKDERHIRRLKKLEERL